MSSDAPSFTDVLRIRTFRVLYAAEVQSIFGDQLARIALSLLVFAQTRSDAATGLTYGLTFLPAIVGGFALARVGDRWPRRAVMISCDIFRAAAFVVMAIPGLSLTIVGAALVLAVFVGPAFSASSVSYLASKLTDQQFRTASGLRMSTNQGSQVAGFALGGVLSGLLGVRETLLLNAATYLISAIAITSLRRRTPQRRASGRHAASAVGIAESAPGVQRDESLDDAGQDGGSALPPARKHSVVATILRNPTNRTMLLLSSLAGFFIVPEGLAVPYAARLGASSSQTGVLLAMIPLGSTIGIGVLTRLIPATRQRSTTKLMAILTGLPLLIPLAVPMYVVACACWLVSGFAAAYQVDALVSLIRSATDDIRARVASVLNSVLLGAQGAGPLVFSALASTISPAGSIAAAGLIGSLVASVVAVTDLVGTAHVFTPTSGDPA